MKSEEILARIRQERSRIEAKKFHDPFIRVTFVGLVIIIPFLLIIITLLLLIWQSLNG